MSGWRRRRRGDGECVGAGDGEGGRLIWGLVGDGGTLRYDGWERC